MICSIIAKKKNLAKIVFLFSDHFNERCGKLTLDMIRDYVEEKNLSIQKDISEKEIDNLICKIKSLEGEVDSLSVHKFEYRLLVICVYYALYDPSGPKNKMLLINNENEIYFFIYYAELGFDSLRNIKSYSCDELNLNYD